MVLEVGDAGMQECRNARCAECEESGRAPQQGKDLAAAATRDFWASSCEERASLTPQRGRDLAAAGTRDCWSFSCGEMGITGCLSVGTFPRCLVRGKQRSLVPRRRLDGRFAEVDTSTQGPAAGIAVASQSTDTRSPRPKNCRPPRIAATMAPASLPQRWESTENAAMRERSAGYRPRPSDRRLRHAQASSELLCPH
jgi:hypothetical protein